MLIGSTPKPPTEWAEAGQESRNTLVISPQPQALQGAGGSLLELGAGLPGSIDATSLGPGFPSPRPCRSTQVSAGAGTARGLCGCPLSTQPAHAALSVGMGMHASTGTSTTFGARVLSVYTKQTHMPPRTAWMRPALPVHMGSSMGSGCARGGQRCQLPRGVAVWLCGCLRRKGPRHCRGTPAWLQGPPP